MLTVIDIGASREQDRAGGDGFGSALPSPGIDSTGRPSIITPKISATRDVIKSLRWAILAFYQALTSLSSRVILAKHINLIPNVMKFSG